MTSEGEDGWGGARFDGNEICGGCLVAVCGTPDLNIRGSTEVNDSFDGLVSRAVLPEADRVMGCLLVYGKRSQQIKY